MSISTDVGDRIESFLRTRFTISPSDPNFGRNVDIFERGYLDSIGVIELIEFLGQEFDVEVPDGDLLSDEFATVDGIARIVRRLRGADGRPA